MLGIKDYFQLDFPFTLRAKFELGARSNDGRANGLKFLAQAHVKFASFYIPQESTEDLFGVCRGLSAFVPEILSLTGPQSVQFPKSDRSWTGEIIALQHSGDFIDISLRPFDGGEYAMCGKFTAMANW